jgi:probable HAF family extracellular repeat protein
VPRRLGALGALLLTGLLVSQAQAGVSPFEFVDLKPPKGMLSYAFDVNLSGQATGVMTDESGFAPVYRGFFYDPDSGLVDIGDLGGANTFAVALNDRGVVTGTSQIDEGAVHAFLYTPGVGMRDLGAGVFPSDISEAGNLIGRLAPSNNAFFWRDVGGFKDLGPGTANAFDRSGGIYGSHNGMPGMWNPSGGFMPFSAPPAPYTKGDALAGNIFGQATGRLAGGDDDASFAWTGTDYQFPALHLFPAPPGIVSSSGQAINDAGVIAVHGMDADGNDLPVLFDAPYDLARGNLDGQSEFVKILDITAIDDVGRLAGAGRLRDGQVHGFVMTPGFPLQAASAVSILFQGLDRDDPFRTMAERTLSTGFAHVVNETSCYQMRQLRKTLSFVDVPWTNPQREAGASALATVLEAGECGNALPIAPTSLPHIFSRKDERVQFTVRLVRPHRVSVFVEAPLEAKVVALNVPKKRVKGQVRITLVARRLLHGGATPATVTVE